MNELSTDTIRELLDYNPNTGIFIWRIRGREWFTRERDCNALNARFAGKEAGYVHTNPTGYPSLLIGVLGKMYLAPRLVFLWMGKDLPEQVDHLNGDSLDNRWLNFKPSTAAENRKNMSMSRSNTSGVTGVYWHKPTSKWQARVGLGGKKKCLGMFDFDDLDLAAMEVMEFRAANGFSARHGQALSAYQEAAT